MDVFRTRGLSAVGCLLSLIALSGCAVSSGRPAPYEDVIAVQKADAPYLSADVRSNKDAGSVEFRNKVLSARIEVIDINYYSFESKLLNYGGSSSLAADLSVLVLNGLGATTGSSAAKAAFAAASAGVVGAKGAVNTDIFYQKTLPALIAQMRADRTKILVIIASGMKQSPTDYSLQQGLADINTYYVAGSLPSALTSVTSQAGSELASSTEELAAVRMSHYVPPGHGSSSEQILHWLYPGGDETAPVNSGNLQALTDWMNAYAKDPILANIPYQTLLTGSGLLNAEADRQQAIIDLNIPKVMS